MNNNITIAQAGGVAALIVNDMPGIELVDYKVAANKSGDTLLTLTVSISAESCTLVFSTPEKGAEK